METQYDEADGKIVNDITSFDFRNAKALPSAIPETLAAIVGLRLNYRTLKFATLFAPQEA